MFFGGELEVLSGKIQSDFSCFLMGLVLTIALDSFFFKCIIYGLSLVFSKALDILKIEWLYFFKIGAFGMILSVEILIKRDDSIDLRHSAEFLVIGCKFSRDNDLINEERLLYLFYDDWLTVGKILKLLA